MLGAQNEFTEDSDLFRLALESRECFPELCETLQDETGIDIQYQASGLIKIANQIDDVAHLRSQFQFLHALDNDVVELSEDELADLTEGNVTHLKWQSTFQMMDKSMQIIYESVI